MCRLAYWSGRPLCILMPSNLLHYAAQNHNGTFDHKMSKAIDNAPKYSILAANLVWVCFNIIDTPQHMVCITECTNYMPPNIPERHALTIGTLIQWIAEQPLAINTESASLMHTHLSTLDSGFRMYDRADGPCIYVLTSCC